MTMELKIKNAKLVLEIRQNLMKNKLVIIYPN